MPVSTIPIPKQNTRFAGSFKTQNIPISSLQGQQLRSGQSPTSVLGADVAPSVVPPLAKVTTSSTKTTATPPPTPSNFSLALKAAGGTLDAPFKTEQLDPSGLNRSTGQYMYGGPQPQLVPLPWKDPTNVGPIVPLPATTQPPPATITIGAKRENISITPEQGRRLRAGEDPGVVLNSTPVTPAPPAPTPVTRTQDIPITPEQSQRLRAGEDPSVVLGQSPTPAAPTPVHRTEDIPITPEQGQRLRAGEDIGTVLGSGILPQVTPGTPLPPAITPESIGPPTVTPLNQLNNPPWTPLDTAIIPDNMGHVITNAELMELLLPMVPPSMWISDMIRAGQFRPRTPIQVV